MLPAVRRAVLTGLARIDDPTFQLASDTLDVLVANTRAIVPGAVIAVRPVGVLLMEDESGQDEKIVAVPITKLTRRYEKVESYADLPQITVEQIEHFFAHYKDLEPGKWVKITRWGGPDEARSLIGEAMERAERETGKASPLGGSTV